MAIIYDEALQGWYNTETGQTSNSRPAQSNPRNEYYDEALGAWYSNPLQYTYGGKSYSVDSPSSRPVIEIGNNQGVYLKTARNPDTGAIYFTGEEEFIPNLNAFNAQQDAAPDGLAGTLTKAAAMAMIGGGVAGAFGVGPAAGFSGLGSSAGGAALAGAGEAATLGSLGSGTMGVNLAGLGSYGTTAGMAGSLGSGLSGTTLASLGLDAAALGGVGAAGAGALSSAGSTGGGMFELGDLTNAWSNALSGGANYLAQNQMMNQMFPRGGGGGTSVFTPNANYIAPAGGGVSA